MKICTKCGVEKADSDFYSNNRSRCGACHVEDVLESRKRIESGAPPLREQKKAAKLALQLRGLRQCTKCEVIKSLDCFREYRGDYLYNCRECQAAYQRSLPYKPRPKRTPEKQAAATAAQRESRKKFPEKELARRLKTVYNLGYGDYKAMLASQNNACACCQHPFTQTPHVDHCHKTGKVRGILCGSCNLGLGSFKDSIPNLNGAISYLQKHSSLVDNSVDQAH